MRQTTCTLLLPWLIVVASAGCNDARKQKITVAPALADAGSAFDASQATARKEAKTIPEAELTAFLTRWLQAQNQGQFTHYEQLYASKFYGIKRAGPRERRFERKGWLEDRKRMFQKPITVEAHEVVLRAFASSAEISLMQHFATGSFHDVGAKRLLVVREEGALKIAHEEMLASRETSQANPKLSTDFDFHFLVTLERGVWLILPELALPQSSGAVRAEREFSADRDLYTTSRALRENQLDPSLRALKGARFRVFRRERGAGDQGCLAQATGFRLLSRAVPHFGEREMWKDPDQPGGRPTQQQIDASMFEAGEKMLAVELSECKTGLYAQREAAPIALAAEVFEDVQLADRAKNAFEKQPQVLADQAEWIAGVEGASGKWWKGSIAVKLFRHPSSRQTLASVTASVPRQDCASIAPTQWIVFELRGRALSPLSHVSSEAAVLEVLDVNGDGRLEFLTSGDTFGEDFQLRSPDPQGPSRKLTYHYMDCPC